MATPPKIAPRPLQPPPVYRAATTVQRQAAPIKPIPLAAKSWQPGTAPPVYRPLAPQPLQTKKASPGGVHSVTLPPPVYRPEAQQTRLETGKLPTQTQFSLQLKNASLQMQRLARVPRSLVPGTPAGPVIQQSAAKKAKKYDWRNDIEQGAGKNWPLNAADRPYNDLEREAKYPGQVVARGDFSAPQKAAIKDFNREKNGGSLKSDAADDPHQDLTDDAGNDTSAEVDHIIPKVRGGCNHYLNARLISRKMNNSVERIKDISALVAATS